MSAPSNATPPPGGATGSSRRVRQGGEHSGGHRTRPPPPASERWLRVAGIGGAAPRLAGAGSAAVGMGIARHTYLQWAVAHFFTMFHGRVQEDWIITRSELLEAGPVYLSVAKPQHEWDEAKGEWLKRKQAKAAASILRALHTWRGEHATGEAATEGEAAEAAQEDVGSAAAAGTEEP
mmetsp:Transcript_20157/g.57106  ORF Transcript_20157/g.57106 Transcript_20157/m.57106 type:complete len:178 (+) Transcript_20157:2-535(+)